MIYRPPKGHFIVDSNGCAHFIEDKPAKKKVKTTRINIDSDENAYNDGGERESGGHTDPDTGDFIEDDL